MKIESILRDSPFGARAEFISENACLRFDQIQMHSDLISTANHGLLAKDLKYVFAQATFLNLLSQEILSDDPVI